MSEKEANFFSFELDLQNFCVHQTTHTGRLPVVGEIPPPANCFFTHIGRLPVVGGIFLSRPVNRLTGVSARKRALNPVPVFTIQVFYIIFILVWESVPGII